MQGFKIDLDLVQHDTGGIRIIILLPVYAITVPVSQMYVEGHVQAATLSVGFVVCRRGREQKAKVVRVLSKYVVDI